MIVIVYSQTQILQFNHIAFQIASFNIHYEICIYIYKAHCKQTNNVHIQNWNVVLQDLIFSASESDFRQYLKPKISNKANSLTPKSALSVPTELLLHPSKFIEGNGFREVQLCFGMHYIYKVI